MKNIVLLGSTGSIGTTTIKIVQHHPQHLRLIALAANQNTQTLAQQAHQLRPQHIAINDPTLKKTLRQNTPPHTKITAGPQALIDLATLPQADIILIAIVGTAGLQPALAALRAGKNIAIASKEILVMAGPIIIQEAKNNNAQILPVDSEHSAIFQCLQNQPKNTIRNLWLTASGGPFHNTPKQQFPHIRPQQALKHPTWNMGTKITIDSATLFNKGLELIEAHHLFNIPIPNIQILIHPQSIIHSLVEFIDGSILSQLSNPDMGIPIQYALTHPKRLPNNNHQTNLPQTPPLTLQPPDETKFPSLQLARHAATQSGTLPAVLNAANETAVQAFCQNKIPFPAITDTVAATLQAHKNQTNPTLQTILQADQWARQTTQQQLAKHKTKTHTQPTTKTPQPTKTNPPNTQTP